MNTVLLFLFFSLNINFDGGPEWSVYQNKGLLAKYTIITENPSLTINRTKIRHNDTLTIRYFSDTPCSKCFTFLYVTDNSGKEIKVTKSKGTFTPFRILFDDFIKMGNRKEYSFFRSEEGRDSRKVLLFKLIIK